MLLYHAARPPFHTSNAVYKCSKWFRYIALIACVVLDFLDVFLFKFKPSLTGEAALEWTKSYPIALPFVITCIIITAVIILLENVPFLRHTRRYIVFCPLAFYLTLHVFDAIPAENNAWLIILLAVVLIIASLIRTLMAKNKPLRIVLTCLGYAAAGALIVGAVLLGNPIWCWIL